MGQDQRSATATARLLQQVERISGHRIAPSSIGNRLREAARCSDSSVERLGYGRYRLRRERGPASWGLLSHVARIIVTVRATVRLTLAAGGSGRRTRGYDRQHGSKEQGRPSQGAP